MRGVGPWTKEVSVSPQVSLSIMVQNFTAKGLSRRDSTGRMGSEEAHPSSCVPLCVLVPFRSTVQQRSNSRTPDLLAEAEVGAEWDGGASSEELGRVLRARALEIFPLK